MERHEQKIQIILRYRSSPICSAWIKAATARAMIHQRAKKNSNNKQLYGKEWHMMDRNKNHEMIHAQ